jgi:hypothetical protein
MGHWRSTVGVQRVVAMVLLKMRGAVKKQAGYQKQAGYLTNQQAGYPANQRCEHL